MVLERLVALKSLLIEQPEDQEPNLTKSEHKRQKKEVQSRVKYNFDLLINFGEILEHPSFNGKLDLGTDVETINWQAMPESMKNCFLPEFDYQPEKITSFTLACKNEVSNNGERQIQISLNRKNQWWSIIYAGMYNRKDYIAPSVNASCKASIVQVEEAEEAMDFINLRSEAPTSNERILERNQHELEMFVGIFNFAVSELERQRELLPENSSL